MPKRLRKPLGNGNHIVDIVRDSDLAFWKRRLRLEHIVDTFAILAELMVPSMMLILPDRNHEVLHPAVEAVELVVNRKVALTIKKRLLADDARLYPFIGPLT